MKKMKDFIVRALMSLAAGLVMYGLVWLGIRIEAAFTQKTELWWSIMTWFPRIIACVAAIGVFAFISSELDDN